LITNTGTGTRLDRAGFLEVLGLAVMLEGSPKMRTRGSVVIGAVLVATLLAPLSAGPALAGGSCEYDGGYYTTLDFAWTSRVSGSCTGVKARHQYDPVWSQYNYWTPWDYDANYALSTAAAELFTAQHGYYNAA
jgi:hypothetical protein